jgi:hypothetical protein
MEDVPAELDPLPLDGRDTQVQKREIMRDEEPYRREPQGRAAPRLDLQNLARIAVSSEDPAYPRKAALEESSGGWKAGDDGPQTFNLSFYKPQTIRHIHVEFHEPELTRTQEFVLRWSADEGRSYRDVVRQQFNFSAPDTSRESEDYVVELEGVTTLECYIIPDISGGTSRASLAQLWIE